jgi:hypothetical protein
MDLKNTRNSSALRESISRTTNRGVDGPNQTPLQFQLLTTHHRIVESSCMSFLTANCNAQHTEFSYWPGLRAYFGS